jgi:putative DNA primase/helicase
LEAALHYSLYLKSHAQRLYGAVEGTDGSSLRLLATKLCDRKLVSGFTARSVYTKSWSGLTKKEHVYLALDQLVELGWLREQVVDTGGRKKTEYTVNPDIPKTLE